MKKQYVWMKVSDDEFELPLVMAGSCSELARKIGKDKSTILSQTSKYEHGKVKKTQYVKVIIELEEDE